MKPYLHSRIRSFGYALKGMKVLITTQPHAQLHAVATVVVIGTGWWLHFQPWEWVAVLICIGMVWMAEALNTALELLADEVDRNHRPGIGLAKDMAAAGVLIAAIASALVGGVILLNHFR